jgi:hypothetical protein
MNKVKRLAQSRRLNQSKSLMKKLFGLVRILNNETVVATKYTAQDLALKNSIIMALCFKIQVASFLAITKANIIVNERHCERSEAICGL